MTGIGKIYKIEVESFKPFFAILEPVETKTGSTKSDYTFIRQDNGKRCYVSMANGVFYAELGFGCFERVSVKEDDDSTRPIPVKTFPINQPS